MTNTKISAIIPAAGSGTRYSKVKNKLFEELQGIPVIIHTLRVVSAVKEIDNIVICASQNIIGELTDLIAQYQVEKVKKVILGGETRQQSVFNGLTELGNSDSGMPDYVLIHDGARPLITPAIIQEAIQLAMDKGAVIVAVPTKDTIKRVIPETGEIIETVDRRELWNVQTPQVFRYREIMDVHQMFREESMTDDAALMEKAGYKVFVSMGSYKNIKITTEEDILVAKCFMDRGKGCLSANVSNNMQN
ncbi:MAG: 2-C-methyl-D-erythritol 4-phosphate cytidylyltransferase [Candidatus Gastranaerophilales bacterium]|nr:2-C-methyl-D-erythritol 4-phosphate cytidylyltransferase [Candidatus Gastranaerophilales bacterium]